MGPIQVIMAPEVSLANELIESLNIVPKAEKDMSPFMAFPL